MRAFYLLILLFCAAFTLSPATTSVTAPIDSTVSLTLRNTEPVPLTLTISVVELQDFVSTSQTEITIPPNAAYQLPLQIIVNRDTLPGTYVGGVIIEEKNERAQTEGVQAVAAAKHTITINVPQEGSFLSVKLLTSQPRSQEEVLISTILENVGTENIREATGRLEIRSGANELIETISLEATTLQPRSKHRITSTYIPPSPGVYSIDAIVQYAGKTAQATTAMNVGVFALRLGELQTSNLRLGEIVRLDLPVISDWNRRITQVHSTFEITSTTEEYNEVFDGITTSIPPRGNALATGYWNTAGLAPGAYNLKISVQASDKTFTKSETIVLGLAQSNAQRSQINFIAGLIVLLAILVSIATILIKRRSKNY